jgi:hypothetical protein
VEEPSRAWTLPEANEALPWVGEVVARAQRQWAEYRTARGKAAKLVRQNGHGLVPADPGAVRSCIDELATQAVVLRDVSRGLVDFPAKASDGRWYWLCWLVGEPSVGWWHWPDDGFAERRPASELPD